MNSLEPVPVTDGYLGRKRLHACDKCRRMKLKCDSNEPCARCTRAATPCKYANQKHVTQRSYKALQNKMEFLTFKVNAMENLIASASIVSSRGCTGGLRVEESLTISGIKQRASRTASTWAQPIAANTIYSEHHSENRMSDQWLEQQEIQLLKYYFDDIHPFYPVVWTSEIISQYGRYSHFSRPSHLLSGECFCVLNMVLAVGALHGVQLQKFDFRSGVEHQYFYQQAQRTNCAHVSYDRSHHFHPVQLNSLKALYHWANHDIDRAWEPVITGIKLAIDLDLQLDDPRLEMSTVENELGGRIWWALYALELLLGSLNGRPSAVNVCEITRKHVSPFQENDMIKPSKTSPSCARLQSLYLCSDFDEVLQVDISKPYAPFICGVQLLVIAQRAYYHNSQFDISQSDDDNFAQAVTGLDDEVIVMGGMLPATESESKGTATAISGIGVQTQLILKIFFHNTRIAIFRTYLLRKRGQETEQSKKSMLFRKAAVLTCIQSAQAIVDLLPENLAAKKVNEHYVWWLCYSQVCSAATVLLTEIAFHVEECISPPENLIAYYRRCLQWLLSMSKEHLMGGKTWEFFEHISPSILGQVIRDSASLRYLPKSTISAMTSLQELSEKSRTGIVGSYGP